MKKSRVIQLRVEPRLGKAIDLGARTLQVSISEFVRSILRSALHVDSYISAAELHDESKEE